MQQADASVEAEESVLPVCPHLAGKAKGLRQCELGRVGNRAGGDAHPLCVGRNLSHINGLLLLVHAHIVDITLAAVLLAVLHHKVAVIE